MSNIYDTGPYISGGSTGMTAGDLKRLREFYASLRERQTPTTVGGGIYSAASDFADALRERRLERAQREVQKNEAGTAATIGVCAGLMLNRRRLRRSHAA